MAIKKTTTTTAAKKGKDLVIVESPTKQRTIGKILGNDYIIKSSFGHVRDLPAKEIGVDEKNDFKPTYVPVEKAKKLVKDLEAAAKSAGTVYLATDPDREGEAIAWHLVELLKLPQEKIKRIFFHEITPSAVKASFEHARNIDLNLVDAQQARRILDRLVGYKLSPLLWKKISRGLSAGRVQSVAVRLLSERAKEIENFKEEEYWTLEAELEKKGAEPKFNSRMLKWKGESVEKTTTYKLFAEDYKVKTTVFRKEEDLAAVNAALRKGPLTVIKVEKKEVKQRAKPPFITSTLQQDAYNKIGFTSQKTMMTAQSLYEGVEIGGENQGLITYMRTDSFNVSKDMQASARKFATEKYGKEFVPATPNAFKSKVKGAQEAHESIHPTDVFKTPQSIKTYLTADQYKLYELIWLRFMASQMADALFNSVTVDIEAGKGEGTLLRAGGRTVKFLGYLSVYQDDKDEDEEEEEGAALLPILNEGDTLNLINLTTKDHKTAPPPNYNEASLIKTLEKHGIGRPSTYAPTIKTIQDRKYITKQPKTSKLVVTSLGTEVTDALKGFFKEIMDLSYTAGVEEELDEIAEGKKDWVKVMKNFYTPFTKELAEADQGMQRAQPKPSDEKCPECGAPMVIRRSRFGEYLACSTYPECKGKINLSGETKAAPEATNEVCDKCGSPMVIRAGRRGKFMACSAYPKCKNTFSVDGEGKKVEGTGKITTDIKCEKCGKAMILRASKRGEFLGCSGYPKCKTIVSVTPEQIADIKKKAEK